MTYNQIMKLQRENGCSELQQMIFSGQCWMMEGFVGRQASSALEAGACMLPKVQKRDYYGNTVPSRYDLKKGTKGTFQNSVEYWTRMEEEA